MNYFVFISFALSFFLSYVSLPMVTKMLLDSKVVCKNYKSIEIPISIGIIFVFTQVVTLSILEILFKINGNFSLIYLLGFVFIGMIGLLDDLIGEKSVKGLKGHIKALFTGTLTTGAIKAILGFFISLVISFHISTTIESFIVNSLLIGLFTNLINLFDLRPGRATKVFLIVALAFILVSPSRDKNYIIYSFFGILIPYIRLDLKAMVMMGDVGSNVLGFSLGIFAAVNFSFTIRVIILIILIMIHFAAEKISFSKIIDNNSFLKYIDNLGR